MKDRQALIYGEGERCLMFCTSHTPDGIFDLGVIFGHQRSLATEGHFPNAQVKLSSCLLTHRIPQMFQKGAKSSLY